MNTNTEKIEKKVYAALLLIALAFAFSSTFNPLNFRRMHVDSSNYLTITQGIIRGQLPYRDFVDNKGPLEYLLSVPGFFLGKFTGVWITGLLLICIAVVFAYKTARFFTDKKHLALLSTAFTFAAALVFFSACAGTEEYSLPFLMVSLYFFTKYLFSPARKVAFIEIIVLGFCFACAVLIRLNMFPLWAGFCAVIFIETIMRRRWTEIMRYVAGFLTGVLIVCVPVFLYLKLNGILPDFIEQVLIGGAARGFDSGGIKHIAKNFFVVVNRNFSYVPFLFGVFMIITTYKKNNCTYYLAYTISWVLAALFLSFSSGGSHYNMTLIPFYVPMISFFAARIESAFSGIQHKNIALALFFCVVFSEGLVKYLDDLAEIFGNHSGKELIMAGKMIDGSTKDGDTIISLGINGYIYPFTQRPAASKYFFQGSGNDHFPGAREAFLSDVLQKKPAVIAIFTAETAGRYNYLPGWYAPVFEMIEREYGLLSDKNGYTLFIRNEE